MVYVSMPGVSASPALASKRVYVLDNTNTAVVFEPGRKFAQVARNAIQNTQGIGHYGGARQEQVLATPAFAGECIYLRGPEYLYCIAED